MIICSGIGFSIVRSTESHSLRAQIHVGLACRSGRVNICRFRKVSSIHRYLCAISGCFGGNEFKHTGGHHVFFSLGLIRVPLGGAVRTTPFRRTRLKTWCLVPGKREPPGAPAPPTCVAWTVDISLLLLFSHYIIGTISSLVIRQTPTALE